MGKYQGVLFDLDGTLIDSKMDIAFSVNDTFVQLGLSTILDEEIYTYIGNGVVHLMRSALNRVLPGDSSGLLDPAVSLFRTVYRKHMLDRTVCYPGVEDTLRSLSDFRMGIVTNKPGDLSVAILQGLGIYSLFSVVLGGDNVINRKPHPEPVLKAIDKLKVPPELSLFVGDSHIDIHSGNAAGVSTCFVSYGLGEVMSTEPDYHVDSFDKLKDILFS